MLSVALDLVLSAQNPDGGWGSTKGRGSTTEFTAFALLALQSVNAEAYRDAIGRGLNWILDHQNADGSWSWSDSSRISSWATSLAILVLALRPQFQAQVLRAAIWALGEEGHKPGLLANLIMAISFRNKPVKVNEDLIGWPWTPGTFSWVEPTGYFLIALKRIRSLLPGTKVDERIHQGESMIYDRMCRGGGWNYGNSEVYGRVLWPYPDVTAVALIALQDHRDAAAIRESFAALQKTAMEVSSGLTLSWSAICYEIYGEDAAGLRTLLTDVFSTTQFLQETKNLALYILALSGGAKYFRI